MILMGNKCDVSADQRSVSTEEGEALALAYNLLFYETSAKTDTNIDKAFISASSIFYRFYYTNQFGYLDMMGEPGYCDRLELTGATSWRKAVINGVYVSCNTNIKCLLSYRKSSDRSISLQQCGGVWYLKTGKKIIGKMLPEQVTQAKDDRPYSSNYKIFYEKMGVFLPIFRQRPAVKCTKFELSGSQDTRGIPYFTQIMHGVEDRRQSMYAAVTEIKGEDTPQDIDLSTFMKFQVYPTKIGLTVELFLRYSVIKVALLDQEYITYKATHNHDKMTEAFAERDEIKKVYKILVDSLSIAAPPPFMSTRSASVPIKQCIATALHSLVQDVDAHYEVLCDSGSISVGVVCWKTSEYLQQTLKSLLFSDPSIVLPELVQQQPVDAQVGGAGIAPVAPHTPPIDAQTAVETNAKVAPASEPAPVEETCVFKCDGKPICGVTPSIESTNISRGHFTLLGKKQDVIIKCGLQCDVAREVKMYELLNFGRARGPSGRVRMFDSRENYIVLEDFGRDIRDLFQPHCQCQVIVMTELLYALQALHSHSIAHGDIKPENILYIHEHGTYRIKLCNLRQARSFGDLHAHDSQAAPPTLLFSAGYCSPEVCAGVAGELAAAPESDVFSLGIVLLQLFNKSTAAPLPEKDPASLAAVLGTHEALEQHLGRHNAFRECEIYFPIIQSMCRFAPGDRVTATSAIEALNRVSHSTLFHKAESASSTEAFLREQILAGISELATKSDVKVVAGKVDAVGIKVSTLTSTFEGFVSFGELLVGADSVQGKCDVLQQMVAAIDATISNQQADGSASVGTETDSARDTADTMRSFVGELSAEMKALLADQSDRTTAESQAAREELLAAMMQARDELRDLKDGMDKIQVSICAVTAHAQEINRTTSALTSSLAELCASNAEREAELAAFISETQLSLEELQKQVEAASDSTVQLSIDRLQQTLASHTTMLQSLITSTHSVPTLVLVLPYVSNTGVLGALNPFKYVKDKYRMYFVCSYTLQLAHCGPKGRGYKIVKQKEWLKKAAPVIVASLVLLKIGLLATGIPLPIPGYHDIVSDVNKEISGEFLDFAMSTIGQLAADSPLPAGDSTESPKINNDIEGSRSAYESIKEILAEQDPRLQHTGLRHAVSNVGKPGWIWDLDSVQQSFAASVTPTAACLQDISLVMSKHKSAAVGTPNSKDGTGSSKKLLNLSKYF